MRKSFFIMGAVLILLAAFATGAFFGYNQRPEMEKVLSLFNKETEKPAPVDFEPFWKAWRIVEERYAAPDGIDREEMVWSSIQGALKSLNDPYTVFFPPEEKKLFESEIKGNFEGVGMEIGIRRGILTVIAPLKGTPAERAGIKPGDKILKIGDKETTDLSTEEAVRLIRGPKGTAIKLTILSEGKDEAREISVTRDVIQIPILDTEAKGDGIFVIKLYNFSERSVFEFRAALRKMYFADGNKLILDLRNNPGGFLEAAVDVASWFVDTGKIVVREKFKSGEENLYRSRGYRPWDNLPIVVLVNRGSASASEIVAGALQDHQKAVLVGEKTYGKGSVQELVAVTGQTALKVTIARWLTPNGTDINAGGLSPDIEVKITEEDESKGRDSQMEKAIEILRTKN